MARSVLGGFTHNWVSTGGQRAPRAAGPSPLTTPPAISPSSPFPLSLLLSLSLSQNLPPLLPQVATTMDGAARSFASLPWRAPTSTPDSPRRIRPAAPITVPLELRPPPMAWPASTPASSSPDPPRRVHCCAPRAPTSPHCLRVACVPALA